ncbi:Flp pilus assembly protein CpaB [Agrobacterium fabrum]|uniref:Flp pilus assembly protein CpaB n=1 Tax=Agrobacterium fabrum TaxID=1176649 RepID=UPI00088C4678|nr:Flp pilus assembly protein CpaB [Agrobacterium fabrum]AYM63783.1 component of type IV pilus, CtpC [Agrobacterium fabrum]MDH6293708.1 pilus assembly protein CpaB [Agrobacterium fabrum]NTE59168.1 Flp pilus assembly protein CpaB [Agrobacterium fabrum]SDB39831.1 pilus assembly protein CpaB [Agrobacterium fabrum]SEQ76168.1 pilus assembly protein CpaB [Agrobacterium fabrum]
MKPSRIVILSVALVAAGLAGLVAMQISGAKQVIEKAETIIQKEPTVNVLVSSVNLPVGSRLNDSSVRWTPWPQGNVVDSFITEAKRPDAITELAGTVVRLPLFEGEPIRPEKVVDSSNRIMSSLLPAGKRAVATEISVSTGAGGFVLPNDRVDVIMVRKGENGNFLTENVLNNVRVLAIDQQIKEGEDGIAAVVGATATLELTPEQAKIITVAQQMADRLTLALRSVADAQENDTLSAGHLLSGSSGQPEIQVIKSGSIVKSGQGASQ